MPFVEKDKDQIRQLVTAGVRPVRLENPKMDDNSWDVIQKCWKAKPSDRPAMEQLVKTIAPCAAFRSLITVLNQVYTILFSCRCIMTYI